MKSIIKTSFFSIIVLIFFLMISPFNVQLDFNGENIRVQVDLQTSFGVSFQSASLVMQGGGSGGGSSDYDSDQIYGGGGGGVSGEEDVEGPMGNRKTMWYTHEDESEPSSSDSDPDPSDPPPEPPTCSPSTTCDASCPAGAECGSVSGTETTVHSDCSTSQSSCTVSCGSCSSDEQFCKEDEVWDRWWECNSYNCEENTALNFDCNNLDGWYCTTDESSKEKRDYTCQGGGCTYDVVETVICEDKHQDWSFSEYGDRTFCKEGGDGPGEECESIPIATDLTWNEEDHNYNSFQHGDFDYPYCSASVPPEVELDWSYHSQTDHSHSESHLQVSQANTDFSTTMIDTTLNNTSYTIDSLDLEFDEVYYWRVKVTDENGHTSDWFNDEELSTTESFETDHRRSHPGFTWSPPSPQLEEEVTFTDTTTEGEFSVIDWSWEFEGGEPAQVEGSPKASTEFTGEIESREADLVVEDADGVRCGITREVNLEPGLPDWKEEDPFSSLLFDFGLRSK